MWGLWEIWVYIGLLVGMGLFSWWAMEKSKKGGPGWGPGTKS